MIKKLIVACAVFCVNPVVALTFTIDKNSDIVGEVQYVTAQKGDTLYTIGRAHDIGLLEMQEANPKIKSEKIKVGTTVLVPTQFILPPGERNGIVVNLAELRVYYFSPDQQTVVTHPLGVGRLGWRTPIGETTIVRKRAHPTWTPPDSIRAYEESKGVTLPDVVPAGPNNPLGEYAMNLGWQNYLMHGTNKPSSVGIRSSSGCMRMYPEDIKNLFNLVEVGTKVRVIYEPYKLGIKDGKLFLEAHELFPENYYNINHDDKFDLLQESINEIQYSNSSQINWNAAKELIHETYGYPVDITGVSASTKVQELENAI